jgi:hypothetical protein
VRSGSRDRSGKCRGRQFACQVARGAADLRQVDRATRVTGAAPRDRAKYEGSQSHRSAIRARIAARRLTVRMAQSVRVRPERRREVHAAEKHPTIALQHQERRRRVALRSGSCLVGMPAGARGRIGPPTRQRASQLARLRRRKLVRRAPALHPDLDLIPRRTNADALELGQAAGILFQGLR